MTTIVYWEPCRENILAPRQANVGDVGFDVAAAVDAWIWPGQTLAIPTGLKVILPANMELQMRPRSGLSLRSYLRLPNSPGTIDPGYRDEIRVLLHHSGYGWPRAMSPELQALMEESRTGDVALDPDYIARCRSWLEQTGLKPLTYDALEPRWAPYYIKRGDRIAQAVPQYIAQVTWQPLDQASVDQAEAQSVPDRQGGFASSGYETSVDSDDLGASR